MLYSQRSSDRNKLPSCDYLLKVHWMLSFEGSLGAQHSSVVPKAVVSLTKKFRFSMLTSMLFIMMIDSSIYYIFIVNLIYFKKSTDEGQQCRGHCLCCDLLTANISTSTNNDRFCMDAQYLSNDPSRPNLCGNMPSSYMPWSKIQQLFFIDIDVV